jgi:hypothetical protein
LILPRRFDLSWILVVLLTVFAIAPLTYPGFFEAQSGFLPTFNAAHTSEAPNWGWVADPVRGEGKLPYLLAWPFFALSGSGVVAIKWGYALTFLLGALGMYTWTRHWLGVRGGVLAATVFTYLPWHLTTVYVRGAYAEAWLWAFWPFILWAIDRLNERRPLSVLAAIAIGLPALAAMLWTQPGLAGFATVLLVAYGTVPIRRPWPVARLAGMLAFSLLFLWIASRQASYTTPFFFEHFLYPFQLVSAAWGEGLSFQLGVAVVSLSIVAVALWLARRKDSAPSAFGRELAFWLGSLLVLVFLTLPVSSFLWQVTGLDALLNYPWQLLALTGMPLAFLAGSVVRLDRRLSTLPAWAGLVTLVILASYPYLAPRFTQVDPGPEPVALLQPVEAETPQILLLDYEIEPPTEITPTLTLTMTWQAVEPVANDYTTFVHVLTADNAKAAQQDTRPCAGECPTNTWQPGKIIVDRYELAPSPNAPPGPYRLAVGLYLLDSGDRAVVVGRDDQMVIFDVP